MAALVSMFNFLRVYLDYFTTIIFGGRFSTDPYTGECHKIAYNIIYDTLTSVGVSVSDYSPTSSWYFNHSGVPICQLFLGIIVVGAIIGLARRLLRG